MNESSLTILPADEPTKLAPTAQAETAVTAAAAQAQATVQARFVMALKQPRDWDNVRVSILKDCKRPGFAASAMYRKPVGKSTIDGLSIRFAEAAMRAMGNLYPEVQTLFDDADKRIIRVSVTDLEANLTYSKDVLIEKTVERSYLRQGQTAISTRTNSKGEISYLVRSTEDDLQNKEGALVSKALRTHALRLLPGDIVDEALALIKETVASGIKADPEAERKRIADAFASLGIQPSDIKLYLDKELAQATTTDIVELRALYNAIKDGEANWRVALDGKLADRAGVLSSNPPAESGKTKAQAMADRLAK